MFGPWALALPRLGCIALVLLHLLMQWESLHVYNPGAQKNGIFFGGLVWYLAVVGRAWSRQLACPKAYGA